MSSNTAHCGLSGPSRDLHRDDRAFNAESVLEEQRHDDPHDHRTVSEEGSIGGNPVPRNHNSLRTLSVATNDGNQAEQIRCRSLGSLKLDGDRASSFSSMQRVIQFVKVTGVSGQKYIVERCRHLRLNHVDRLHEDQIANGPASKSVGARPSHRGNSDRDGGKTAPTGDYWKNSPLKLE